MRPDSRETSTNTSFWLAVWSELLRIVLQPVSVVAASSWVWDIAAVALAAGVPAAGGTARLGEVAMTSAPIPASTTEAILRELFFGMLLIGWMERKRERECVRQRESSKRRNCGELDASG